MQGQFNLNYFSLLKGNWTISRRDMGVDGSSPRRCWMLLVDGIVNLERVSECSVQHHDTPQTAPICKLVPPVSEAQSEARHRLQYFVLRVVKMEEKGLFSGSLAVCVDVGLPTPLGLWPTVSLTATVH